MLWRAFKDLEPAHAGRGIGDKMRHCFLAAWNTSAPPLSDAPAFQHLFLALCTLADWLGSNELWFPFNDDPDADYIAIARERAQRAAARAGALPTFTELFGISGATPNAIQSQAAVATALDEPLVVIESETGSGRPRLRSGASPACMRQDWWTASTSPCPPTLPQRTRPCR